jgi:hypothetical protein
VAPFAPPVFKRRSHKIGEKFRAGHHGGLPFKAGPSDQFPVEIGWPHLPHGRQRDYLPRIATTDSVLMRGAGPPPFRERRENNLWDFSAPSPRS